MKHKGTLKLTILGIGLVVILAAVFDPLRNPALPGHARLLLERAEQGDIEAQYELASLFLHGDRSSKITEPAFVPQNLELAEKWYEEAAMKGHIPSQRMLGRLYDNGALVEQDLKEAEKWYRMAADQNDPEAQMELAWLLPRLRVEPNRIKDLVRKSANNGSSRAQLLLGNSYYSGRWFFHDFPSYQEAEDAERTPDHDKASYWWKAASRGHDTSAAQAAYRLANMYFDDEEGDNVPPSKYRAIELLKRSAQIGNVAADEQLTELGVAGYGDENDQSTVPSAVTSDPEPSVSARWCLIHRLQAERLYAAAMETGLSRFEQQGDAILERARSLGCWQ